MVHSAAVGSIGVIGGGSWGTALGKHLADKGYAVTLWCRRPEAAAEVRETHQTKRYLPGIELPRTLVATADLEAAVRRADVVLAVVPSHTMREVMAAAGPLLPPGAPIVSCTKGIENGTLMLMAEVLREVLPAEAARRLTYLSGPSFAREVALGLPTAVTIAGEVPETARAVQDVFAGPRFRAYVTEDVVGVEVGGALKNVMAIAAGAADGLGFGHNTIAALITRGLAEIARLGAAMGANPLTLAGLAGLGDLVLTCTGGLSRNRHVGVELGKGKTIEQVLGDMTQVAEGVKTARAARDLARRRGVEMPITEAVYQILYEGMPVHEAVVRLMAREARAERD
ncbi:MAG TPA: NAD(P)H-dependent glycerol-3-phosphate dehydrogenase [Myxococcota bacterium]|jgi:glycerol-3-phosphate dehydrogenase (NAD(P)+)|nr:NAD(P)H-dependent glycerol-3-phosphate dehydrogenase [Myxococcota bacterium]